MAACALLVIHAQARPAPMQNSQLPQGPPSIPSLRVESDDHACTTPYAFGRAIGVRFAQEVATRVSKSRDLAALRTCMAEGGERAAILQEMWRENEQTFPRFAAEVNGTADGAGVSRDDLVLLNLRKELRYVCASYMKDIPHVTHCSDQLVAPLDVQMPRVVGHNEDGACEDAGLLYWVDAPVGCGGGDIPGNDDGARFAAITYAGELPSAAFGLNSYGVAVTFNALSPLRLSPVSEAPLARNLVSRASLVSRSVDDAIKVLSMGRQAVGHNAQVFAWRDPAGVITSVEIGPASYGSSVLRMHDRGGASGSGVASLSFHANAYLRLPVPEGPQPSSVHRLRRARALWQSGTLRDATVARGGNATRLMAGVWAVLLDHADVAYPIYQSGEGGHDTCTLVQAVFALGVSPYVRWTP